MAKPTRLYDLFIMGTGRRYHVYAVIEAHSYKKALNEAVRMFPQQHSSRFRLEPSAKYPR